MTRKNDRFVIMGLQENCIVYYGCFENILNTVTNYDLAVNVSNYSVKKLYKKIVDLEENGFMKGARVLNLDEWLRGELNND